MSSFHERIQELSSAPPNAICADCSTPHPKWASTNNCVFICTQCSGVHRNLGVEFSFVQSVNMDTHAWTEEMVNRMVAAGSNHNMNEILEYHVPAEFMKPNPTSERATRERYIEAKYKHKVFSKASEGEVRERLPPVVEPVKDHSSEAQSIGEIEFVGILFIRLISGKDLMNMDLIGTSDPYVTFHLGHQTMTSKFVRNSLNPVWNEKLSLSWDGRSKLLVECWDKDWTNPDDPLGNAELDLTALSLTSGTEVLLEDVRLTSVAHGSLKIALTLNTFT